MSAAKKTQASEAVSEWSGSQAPEDPDNWWVDDETGEYVKAPDGPRVSAARGRALIAKAQGRS